MADKILIVHEDIKLIEDIKAGLATSGAALEVVSVLSGPRALGIVEAQRPKCVLIDAELEGMDGFALTKQIKGSAYAEAPVIVVSKQSSEASALMARQAGASAHMSSQGSVDMIVARIIALAGTPAAAMSNSTSPSVVTGTPLPADTPAAAPHSAPATQVREPASLSPSPSPAPSAQPSAVPPAVSPIQPAPERSPAPAPAPSPTTTASQPATDIPHVDDLLRLMLERNGSDLHVTVGSPPGIRMRGEIVPVENSRPLTPKDVQAMILSLLSEEQRKKFDMELELDFAYSIPGVSRFRTNVFQQRNSIGAVFRVIPLSIPSLEDLALPKVAKFLAERPRGLVLVTGPTGSGKSTTLAAMIDHINATRPLHIITMEDPIEFMHRNKRAYVNQREIGSDSHSFTAALKRVLRQDPDVILVGEMRDLETIAAAITAAETGHLVLATLHTTGGPETIDRIIDVFPPHQQQQVRMQLSNTLEGVLSQVLLRHTDGRSRVMAMEIMLGIPAIRNLIREGKTHQMATIIQGGGAMGMQTLDQNLKSLLQSGKITFEEAVGKAQNPRELAAMVGRKL